MDATQRQSLLPTVRFRRISTGIFKGLDAVLEEAAAFATSIGPERVVSISQTETYVIVWYWDASQGE
jgi:hypothetical protein